jgi:heterodisulfide reductase subunit A
MRKKIDVAIIGGGISGMEAASTLSRLGARIALIEKKEKLGGHVAQWHRLFPDGSRSDELLTPLYGALDGVDTYLNTTVKFVGREQERYQLTLSDDTVLDAAAVLLTTGFTLFAAQRKEEYGYGIYDNVLTSIELEESFVNEKGLGAKSNEPLRIGFVHCVGSRDEKVNNRNCSKVCCTTAVKQASELKELHPNARIFCFYMDLRMFGRYYEDLYLQAQNKFGVQFIRGRVSEVSENIEGKLIVKAEDTLAGQPLRATLDYLVLMSGMEHHEHASQIASLFNISFAEDGFFQNCDPYNNNLLSKHAGLFFAGACTGAKTYADCMNEARAAAVIIYEYLRKL